MIVINSDSDSDSDSDSQDIAIYHNLISARL